MSTQRGNHARTRPQKHKNATAFKNTLHDTSKQTKTINSIRVSDVCERCKEIIEWKIKYKKYKPLTQPRKCVRCERRSVKHAYHVMCSDCGRKFGVCTKCCEAKEVVRVVSVEEEPKLDAEMQALLKTLPERKRRTFLRFLSRRGEEKTDRDREELLDRLNALKVEGDGDDEDGLSDFSDE